MQNKTGLKTHHPKHHLRRWIMLFALWLAVFVFVIKLAAGDNFVASIAGADGWLVLLSLASFLLAHAVSLANWGIFVRASKIRFRFRRLAQILASGLFVDHVLPPIAPGGEIAMAYLLSRESKRPFSRSLATVTIHSVTWFVSFILLTLGLIIYLIYQGRISTELTILSLAFLFLFALLLWFVIHLALEPELCKKLARRTIRYTGWLATMVSGGKLTKTRLLKWAENTVDSFSHSFDTFLHAKKLVFASCCFMVLHHLFLAFSFFFILSAFRIAVPPANAMAIYMFISLVSLLSFVPGQLGVFEITAFILVSLAAGTNAATVVLAIAVFRLIQYWSVIFAGGFFALKLELERLVPVES
ncbi:flippase-like domain-containing protein [archaeon]|nr:flippase-like domain-containing protein [archaeon]